MEQYNVWRFIIFDRDDFFSIPVLADENIDTVQPEEVVVENESTVSSQEDQILDDSLEETLEIIDDTDQVVVTDTAGEQLNTTEAAVEQMAKHTILLYDCGANLETDGGMASYNLRQILSSSFSEEDDIRFIVMTCGSLEWQLESDYLSDPYGKGITVNDAGGIHYQRGIQPNLGSQRSG